MKKSTWMIRGVVAVSAWTGIGFAAAQAAVIYPVDPATRLPISGSTVTVSILKGGADVTATWLPEPGDTVQVVVNGLASPSISLVFASTRAANPIANSALTTSAYPGQCTNFNNPATLAANAPDFGLAGNNLTSTDCGGMAVIQVTDTTNATPLLTFILPQDSNFNGIPDIWEATFCTATIPCATGKEDSDTSAGNTVNGDGIAALDEYRGFIVSGVHIRTDPRQKDLFVHLVNPQCGTDSFLGGGTTTFATGDALFGNLNTLISGTQIHRLGYRANETNYTTNEWVDNFQSYSVATGFVYTSGTDGAISDRQINLNAVYPVTNSKGTTIQKGLRITECLDESTTSPLGVASLGSPNGPDNAILYTKRILNYSDNTLNASTTKLCYSTFKSGSWTAPVSIAHDDLIAKAIGFYTAMEIGHSVQLTPTVEGTRRTSYGYHHAPGTGSNLDQAIVNKPTAKCGNLFQIPSLYNTSDQSNFKLK